MFVNFFEVWHATVLILLQWFGLETVFDKIMNHPVLFSLFSQNKSIKKYVAVIKR